MDLQPLGDRLIVEALEDEETTASGIVLPDTAKEKPQRGRVLAVGPGARNDKGDVVPMDVAVGDEIIFSKYGGTEIKLGADEVLVLPAHNECFRGLHARIDALLASDAPRDDLRFGDGFVQCGEIRHATRRCTRLPRDQSAL